MFFLVSGLRNPAYSDFHLDRADQTGSSRTVTLRTNRTFNYDEPGATRVWFLNIIATDHGIPPRQGNIERFSSYFVYHQSS